MHKILFFILSFFFASTSIIANTYYIDVVNGNNKHKGLDPEKAFKTHNGLDFNKLKPGDEILFKAGQTHFGPLVINQSGTKKKPILFSSYGEGGQPILTNRYELQTTWTRHNNSDIWKSSIKYKDNILRLWSNNVEQKSTNYTLCDGKKNSLEDALRSLNIKQSWYYDTATGNLYYFSNRNPSTTTIETSGNANKKEAGNTILIKEASHINLKGLDIRGATKRTIFLYGTIKNGVNYINIEKCIIGKEANVIALYAFNASYVKISDSIIDSDLNLKYDYRNSVATWGIKLEHGSSYWKICDNKFYNWNHSALYLINSFENKPSIHHNLIENNYITSEKISYGRGFATAALEPQGCHSNIFRNNVIHLTKTRCQIGGNNNIIEENLFISTINSEVVCYKASSTGQGIGITAGAFKTGPGVSTENIIRKNVFYNIQDDIFWMACKVKNKKRSIANNKIIDNTIIRKNNNKANYTSNLILLKAACDGGSFGSFGDEFNNNVIYFDSNLNKPMVKYYDGVKYNEIEFNAFSKHKDVVTKKKIQFSKNHILKSYPKMKSFFTDNIKKYN